ncbi:Alpha/beta hydrolase family protein [Streptoalloteichus tenebrarius]|uniref:Alpha/beta hydrolase family protein n=1 Tax=Streptoalloteichus tenebrarius (strain ATCC 17920 / DSM 40477 / JCM 4838 / CBS 697.72 / NBRC 16177 / NCIMB 11028 / NRRL B-12390 / A12253. 1 / ISP 5477) TaxID=1933 RepID=A0ABT1HPA2_STRSD|nr:alpha/beta fold hydrolase [Streptoalloteichus tenebrarius]MCP2257332.1 Alpha/beta hydrolase family protein [Streptoalloteichus tenebrarius]BFF04241.1 alpha/beta hydrolase [Streptoalloteichus tenebrarius]
MAAEKVEGVRADAGRRPTFVFVHGSGSNAFLWTSVIRELALLGHRALAVDLPGHGFDAAFPLAYQAPQDLDALVSEPSAMAAVRLEDNVEHVVGLLRRVAEHGPVVLVGHSLGGATITRVASEAPELVDRLVYVAGWCCVRLRSVADYLQTPEFQRSLLLRVRGLPGVDRRGAGRTNWRSADPAFLADAHAAMMGDASEEEFRAVLNTLQPDESLRVFLADSRPEPATWGAVPRTYVRLTLDRTMTPELQDLLIREADALTPDNPFEVRDLATSHLGFVRQPSAMAKILDSLDWGPADLDREPGDRA